MLFSVRKFEASKSTGRHSGLESTINQLTTLPSFHQSRCSTGCSHTWHFFVNTAMTSCQEFWSIRPKCFLFFPAIIPVIWNSENNHGKPHHFAIPAIPRPGFFYIATMGLKKKTEKNMIWVQSWMMLVEKIKKFAWNKQKDSGAWQLRVEIWFVSLTSCISYCKRFRYVTSHLLIHRVHTKFPSVLTKGASH